jgi:hypothetical protein
VSILERIKQEMAAKFPAVPTPQWAEGTAAVASAYLQAQVKFTQRYFENETPFDFQDSTGKRTPVASFGLRSRNEDKNYALRRQADVLFWQPGDGKTSSARFAVDPCKSSTPNQLVLAVPSSPRTLAGALAEVEQEMARAREAGASRDMGSGSDLLVPNMDWRTEHHFAELEKKSLLNPPLPGLYLDTALQAIRLRLDCAGVDLKSEARIASKSVPPKEPMLLYFDRPFLLYVKKRDAQRPFFVMWVDNAELLQERE